MQDFTIKDVSRWIFIDFINNIFIPHQLNTVTWKRENFLFPEKELLLDNCKNITIIKDILIVRSYFKITEYKVNKDLTLFLIQH